MKKFIFAFNSNKIEKEPLYYTWEATEEQIENHYYVLFPKMTPIPVYE